MSDERGPSTRSVRGGEPKIKAHDAVTVPISATATYGFESTSALVDYFDGKTERMEYGRYGNPSVRAAELKIADLDGAEDCALFASGMAAITTALLAMLKSGHHLVMTSDCYRRTRQFISGTLSNFGVESTLVEPGDHEALERAIRPGKTRILLSESPTNPYLRVADLEKMGHIAKKHRLKLIIDSTFATPVNQRPIELGADLVLHSATKYLGGHNDLLAGSISGKGPLVQAIRDVRGVLGGVLDPHAAYLLIRGMKTLALRVERQNASAMQIAGWLERHPAVERVYYPGLASHPDHDIAKRQMKGFGGVVSFLVKGGTAAAQKLVDSVELCTIAPSLGGVETLIEQPSIMSYYELTPEQRLEIGIRDELIRLAVGIEDTADIQRDLERALAKIS
jgi:cystathionine gamma-synthase